MGVTSYLLTGIWAIYYKSLICIKAILGRIPLLNYFLGWPTGGLVALNCLVGWSSKYECHPHIFCRSLQFTLPPCRVCGPSRTVLAVVHRGPSCHALYLENVKAVGHVDLETWICVRCLEKVPKFSPFDDDFTRFKGNSIAGEGLHPWSLTHSATKRTLK